jgi:hypothetical protein
MIGACVLRNVRFINRELPAYRSIAGVQGALSDVGYIYPVTVT